MGAVADHAKARPVSVGCKAANGNIDRLRGLTDEQKNKEQER